MHQHSDIVRIVEMVRVMLLKMMTLMALTKASIMPATNGYLIGTLNRISARV